MAFDEFTFDDDGDIVPAQYPPGTVEYAEDDFEEHVRRAKERDAGRKPANASAEAWALLTQGKTIGKKVMLYQEVLGYGPAGSDASIPVNILELVAPDRNALDLCITLRNPQNVGLDGGNLPPEQAQGNIQQLTGETDSDTADFGINVSGPSGIGCPHNPVAFIEWGIGGVQANAEVDFVNGTTINVRASFLRVSAFLEIFDTNFSWLTALSAFVGPQIGANNVAQRTFTLPQTLTPLAADTMSGPVPRFAREFTVGHSININNDRLPLLVTFERGNGLLNAGQSIYETVGDPAGAASQVVNALRPGERAPIPNGAMIWRMSNLSNPAVSGDSIVNPLITFFLAL